MGERVITIRITDVDFPEGVHGASMKDGAGDSYIVAINANDAPNRREKAFLHELRHIYNHDHDRKRAGVSSLEKTRHEGRHVFSR